MMKNRLVRSLFKKKKYRRQSFKRDENTFFAFYRIYQKRGQLW